MPYLTRTEAQTRLQQRYNIAATLTDGHVEAGSNALDELRPFVAGVDLDSPATLPDALKDYVALYAYMLADQWPGPVVQDSMSPFSTHYARPEPNPHARTARELVAKYLKRSGARV